MSMDTTSQLVVPTARRRTRTRFTILAMILLLLKSQPDIGMLAVVTFVFFAQLFVGGLPLFFVGVSAAGLVLSGINPNVARSIIHMGVELSGIQTYRSLRDALQHYVRRHQRGTAPKNGEAERRSPDKTSGGSEKPE